MTLIGCCAGLRSGPVTQRQVAARPFAAPHCPALAAANEELLIVAGDNITRVGSQPIRWSLSIFLMCQITVTRSSP
jgi:hypothetical protein